MTQYNSQESVLPPPLLSVKNRFFSKSAPGKISHSMVFVLYTHELGKTAKKPTVMSISPWIGHQTVVPGGGTDGRTDGQKDGRMDVWKFTPVSYRTSALWGCCPKRQEGKIVAKALHGQRYLMPQC